MNMGYRLGGIRKHRNNNNADYLTHGDVRSSRVPIGSDRQKKVSFVGRHWGVSNSEFSTPARRAFELARKLLSRAGN